MRAQLLALSPLSREAQHIIATSRDTAMVTALASSPYLQPDVATLLYKNKSTLVRHMVLRVLDDVSILSKVMADSKPCCRQEAARNKHLPVDQLVTALTDPDIGVALAAAINPNTPETNRKEILTPQKASAITDVGTPLARSVVRASMLALANPWMAENAERHCSRMRRAFTGLPDLSSEKLALLRQSGWTKFLERHPALSEHPEEMSVDGLIALGSPAADMRLVVSSTLSAGQAQTLTMRHPVYPESHVIGLLVQRFGAAPLAHADRRRIAGTRMESAWWVTPAVRTIAQMRGDLTEALADVEEARSILAASPSDWEAFIRLYRGWEGRLSDLANAANRL